jgi:hypothetical protein
MLAEDGTRARKVSGYRLQASGKKYTRKPSAENVTISSSNGFMEPVAARP